MSFMLSRVCARSIQLPPFPYRPNQHFRGGYVTNQRYNLKWPRRRVCASPRDLITSIHRVAESLEILRNSEAVDSTIHSPRMCMVLRYGVLGGSRRLDLLHSAAHPRLVAQVFLAEDAFHVLLLTLDLVALDHVQHQRQEQDGPKRVPEGGYPRVDHGHREVGGVAGVAKRSVGDQLRHLLSRVDRGVSVPHREEEPSVEQHPAGDERPPEAAYYVARQEGNVDPLSSSNPKTRGSR